MRAYSRLMMAPQSGNSNSSSHHRRQPYVEEENEDYCSNIDDETLPLMGGENNDEGEKKDEPTEGTSEQFYSIFLGHGLKFCTRLRNRY